MRRVDADADRRRPDDLIVEEPMSIQLDDVEVASTMRTPGHDFELAVGFCHGEGLLDGHPVVEVRYCGTGSAVETEFNVVSVSTGGKAPEPAVRTGLTTSSCGWCGSDLLDDLGGRLTALPPRPEWPTAELLDVADAMTAHLPLFNTTGAVHGAAAFTHDGEVLVVREDVGRHNAVDKVVGRLLLDDRLPARDLGLFVSGRASYEIVQKAWAAGFDSVVAVSAPTSLAVETARRANLGLVGFLRDGAANRYSPASRPA